MDNREYIEEINRFYHILGEDLLMLESLLLLPEGETGFSEKCAAASRERAQGYAIQHMEEIDLLMSRIAGVPQSRTPYFPLTAQK